MPLQLLAVIHALSLILHLVPHAIKLAVVVGMGLLLSFIGLQVGCAQADGVLEWLLGLEEAGFGGPGVGMDARGACKGAGAGGPNKVAGWVFAGLSLPLQEPEGRLYVPGAHLMLGCHTTRDHTVLSYTCRAMPGTSAAARLNAPGMLREVALARARLGPARAGKAPNGSNTCLHALAHAESGGGGQG